jgi:hypothetical protein
MIIDTPALHGMEYVYSLFVNNIIHDFKQVSIAIKTNKQMLVFGIIPYITLMTACRIALSVQPCLKAEGLNSMETSIRKI